MISIAWALLVVALLILGVEWLDGRVRLDHAPRPHAWRKDGGFKDRW